MQCWAQDNKICIRHKYTETTRLTRIIWKSQNGKILHGLYKYESLENKNWKVEETINSIAFLDESN